MVATSAARRCARWVARGMPQLEEDAHPWIEQNPRATVVVMVLRRIAYTLLALWRGVMRAIELAVIKATAGELAGLRRHRLAPPPA